MTNDQLLNLALPKWPQMVVSGQTVTVDQAKEIIRRTDAFFTMGFGGNDREYDLLVRLVLGKPIIFEWDRRAVRDLGFDVPDKTNWQEESGWAEKWDCIDTGYVTNAWISSSFIYGPHGWCHPDGRIGFTDNVGKWPSVEAVLDDWKKLAAAFTFLDVGVTLMSGESCEEDSQPVVSIDVSRGTANLYDPAVVDVHRGHKITPIDRSGDAAIAVLRNRPRQREHGIDPAWILEWAERDGPLTGQRLRAAEMFQAMMGVPRG